MPWPSASDYQDALLDPNLCFNDTELMAGQAKKDRLGFPKPDSGTFACVYEVSNTGRTWAVRCFLGQVADRQQRYQALYRYLQAHPLPYFVRFEFLDQGIRVRGVWYPVLKMEWVNGKHLDAFVRDNVEDPSKLRAFAAKWLRMAAELRAAGIAHGDLQHGNILITPSDELRLIDYDGMFVPDLAGNPPNELGHPAYQHPRRSLGDYSATMDAFSEWIIFGTALALAADPQLWTLAGAGDDRLVFGRNDYSGPSRSEAFRAMEGTEGVAGEFANFVEKLLHDDPSRLPSLSPESAAFLTKAADRTGTVDVSADIDEWLSRFSQYPAGHSGAGASTANPLWLDSWINPEGNGPPPSSPAGATRRNLQDNFGIDVSPLDFETGKERWFARAFLMLTLCAVFVIWATTGLVVLASLMAAALTLFLIAALFIRYRSLPQVIERAERHRQVAERRNILASLEGQALVAQGALDKLAESVRQDISRMRKELDGQKKTQSAEIADSNRRLQRGIAAAQKELAGIDTRRDRALNEALAAIREQYVTSQLSAATLQSARIPGIGDGMTLRLNVQGIHSAADIVDVQVNQGGAYGQLNAVIEIKGQRHVSVPGIGEARGWALLNWRRAVEERARSRAPQAIPAAQRDAIVQQISAERSAIENRIAGAAEVNQEELRKIRLKYRDLGPNQAKREAGVREQSEARRIELLDQARMSGERRDDAKLALAASEQQLSEYRRITFLMYLQHLLAA